MVRADDVALEAIAESVGDTQQRLVVERRTCVGTFNGGILGGSTGNLTISGAISAFMPPPPTTVPDVREQRKSNAIAEVLAAGLTVRTTGTDGPDAWVFSQSPAAGTVVAQGSVVTLQLRTGPIA